MFNFLRHLFIPHHTNNYRAKILQYDFFLIYAMMFIVISFTFKGLSRISPDILGYASDIQVSNLLRITNEKRNQNGLTPLKLNEQLSQAAINKANYMFNHNFWAHMAPDGTTPWDFITDSGYLYAVAGENLAKNFSNSDGVVEAWINSASHRENILRSQYEDIGFAVVNGVLNGEQTTLVVQMFGKRLTPLPFVDSNSSTMSAIGRTNLNNQQLQFFRNSNLQNPLPSFIPELIQSQSPTKPVEITTVADSIVRKPLFDIFSISKKLLFALSTGLILAFIFDAIYIWQRKIVRINGRTLAHLSFLLILTSLFWYISLGSIL